MGLIGQKRNYFKKFLYTLEVPGIGYAGFVSVSSIEGEFANIQHWEGGSMTPDNSPGRFTTSEATATRGATTDLDLWQWFKRTGDLVANEGEMESDLMVDCELVQKNRDGSEARRWKLWECYCRKFVAGEWNNGADENVLESCTFVYRIFTPKDDQAST